MMQRVEQCIDIAGVRYVQMDECVCAREAICMCGETLSTRELVSHNIHNEIQTQERDVRCGGGMRRESSSSSLRCRRPDTRYADTLLGCMQSGAVVGGWRRQRLNSCSRNSVGYSWHEARQMDIGIDQRNRVSRPLARVPRQPDATHARDVYACV